MNTEDQNENQDAPDTLGDSPCCAEKVYPRCDCCGKQLESGDRVYSRGDIYTCTSHGRYDNNMPGHYYNLA